jgi:hypothetical protein
MKKFIFVLLTPVLFFLTVPSAMAEEFVLGYETAFTLRDSNLDGEADDLDAIEDVTMNRFWGLITNADNQIDEFLLEFDISDLEPACSAKFRFSFSSWGPARLPYELYINVYEADGDASLDDFGAETFFASVVISNIEENVFLVDLTSVFNDYITRKISHLGIRLYDPVSIISPGDAAQLRFKKLEEGNLAIIPTAEIAPPALEDTTHPMGAVHGHPKMLHWPSKSKRVDVEISGYVLDELSIARDSGGIGVSRAFLDVDNRIIILKDDSTNLLDENGRFNINVKLHSKKYGVYQIKLYAADTLSEGPNFGLVDSTAVAVSDDMNGKKKVEAHKFEKSKKH